MEVGGRKIKDAERLGVLTFKEVIQKSSNVGTIKIGLGLGKDRIYSYIKKFGFGEKTGFDLGGEATGLIRPSGAVVRHVYRSCIYRTGGCSDAVASAAGLFGNCQWRIACQASCCLGNHVSGRKDSYLQVCSEPQRILSEKTVTIFKNILKTVTEDWGDCNRRSC